MRSDLLLGLDGGGSKTVVAVADRSGAVTLYRRGAGLDPMAHPDWPDRLSRLVEGSAARVGRAALALPFHMEIEAISEAQRRTVATLFPMPHEVMNDVRAAFEGALAGRAGVLVLAGTGSMAWAGDGAGLECRVGGWGDIFGDEGSAYWVGREALSETARALDGRTSNRDLAQAILDALGITGAELIGWSYALADRRSTIASIAASVDRLSCDGEPAARSLLVRAADHLVEHVRAAWAGVGEPGPLVWTYAGGLFGSGLVRDHMTERLGEPEASRLPPVGGALLRAARAAGAGADEAWISRLAQSLRAAAGVHHTEYGSKQGEAA